MLYNHPQNMKRFKGVFFLSLSLCLFCQINSLVAQNTMIHNRNHLQSSFGKQLFDQGFFQASQAYSKVVLMDPQLSPTRSEAYKDELSNLELYAGLDIQDAESLNKALAKFNQTSDVKLHATLAFYLANYYFKEGDYASALSYFEHTDDSYLSEDRIEYVQYVKGVAYFSLNNFSKAKPFLESIAQLDKSNYKNDVTYYLGFISFSEQNYEMALGLFNQLVEVDQYKSVIPFYIGYIYNDKGESDKAIEVLERFIKSGSLYYSIESRELLSSVYFNKGDFQKSVSLYETLQKDRHSLDAIQRLELGIGYHEVGSYTKAIEVLKPLSVESSQIASQAAFYLGDSFLQIGEKESARNAFSIVISKTSSNNHKEIASFFYAKLSLELGFFDQGFQKLSTFLSDYSNSPYLNEAQTVLMTFYAKTNNFQKALTLLESSSIDRSIYSTIAPRIYFGRAMESINEVKYQLVYGYLDKVLEFRNSNFFPYALFWKGEILFREKKYTEAIKYLADYIRINPFQLGEASAENAYYDMGYANFALENYDKAYSFFDKIIESKLVFDNDKLRECIVRAADCLFMQKKMAKAKSLYAKVADGSSHYGSIYAAYQLAIIQGISSSSEKINSLKLILTNFPTSAFTSIILLELANTYMSEELYESAIVYLSKLSETASLEDKLKPEIYLKLGIAQYNLENTEQSIAFFRKVIKEFPSSEEASEAVESARSIYVKNGKLDDFQTFLESGGRSINAFQKDSLQFQFVQSTFTESDHALTYNAIEQYLRDYPNGLFITDVLAFKSDLLKEDGLWKEAAESFSQLSHIGPSKYEKNALNEASKIYFFELRDYKNALPLYLKQYSNAVTLEDKLLSLRGIVRCYYFTQRWEEGGIFALQLLDSNSNLDDLSYARVVLGYKFQSLSKLDSSSYYFKKVINRNSLLGAEAGFQLALNEFNQDLLDQAEASAMDVISKENPSDYWESRCYIFLGNLFFKQKDFFNAKATLESVIENCKIKELVTIAEEDLKRIKAEEQRVEQK